MVQTRSWGNRVDIALDIKMASHYLSINVLFAGFVDLGVPLLECPYLIGTVLILVVSLCFVLLFRLLLVTVRFTGFAMVITNGEFSFVELRCGLWEFVYFGIVPISWQIIKAFLNCSKVGRKAHDIGYF